MEFHEWTAKTKHNSVGFTHINQICQIIRPPWSFLWNFESIWTFGEFNRGKSLTLFRQQIVKNALSAHSYANCNSVIFTFLLSIVLVNVFCLSTWVIALIVTSHAVAPLCDETKNCNASNKPLFMPHNPINPTSNITDGKLYKKITLINVWPCRSLQY